MTSVTKKTIAVSLMNWQWLNQIKIDNNLDDLDDALSSLRKPRR